MIRLLKFLVQLVFWIQAFAGPVLVMGLIALFVYSKGEKFKELAILIQLAGVIAGVIVAELIRRKYSLDNFFGNIRDSVPLSRRSKESDQNEIGL
jgi:hypothetical protein